MVCTMTLSVFIVFLVDRDFHIVNTYSRLSCISLLLKLAIGLDNDAQTHNNGAKLGVRFAFTATKNFGGKPESKVE